MKAVCNVLNTTANTAARGWAYHSQSEERWMQQMFSYRVLTLSSTWQDQNQQIKLKAMTIYSKLHSILSGSST